MDPSEPSDASRTLEATGSPGGVDHGADLPASQAAVDADTGEGELERTIGLVGALAIGIGTMVGAGIFVFPGLAAARAGPAASLSFAIGAGVALLVALPTAELATAMPHSGGGYVYVSRALGTGAGAVVGLGLWLGLVFASAFYLVGLGSYAGQVLVELGVSLSVRPAVPLGVAFGVALTALSLFGTENTATLQNAIVVLLVGILALFLTYGSLDALGVFGTETAPERFFPPGGALAVVQTAAFVFTSYLGFAQIATVAGDVESPGRTLPLAMVGSVVTVGGLYVVAIFVATSAFGSARLGTFGETAMVEVARAFIGLPGAIAIVVAGLLATLSSANASILSGSRMVYAVSRDGLIPEAASRINIRYGTPHVALGLAGVPIVALTATGRVGLLAEVASVLHLVAYGLTCVALIQFRRERPGWYDPSFRCPAGTAVAGSGALASVGLIGFMQPASIAVGTAVMVAAYGWYRAYATDVDVGGERA
jgi:amino acid transporter